MKALFITDELDLSLLDRQIQRFALDSRVPVPCDDPVAYLTGRIQYDPALRIESIVADGSLADLFSVVLRIPVAERRIKVRLTKDETALIGHYQGPRLAFGATELPLGATLDWWLL